MHTLTITSTMLHSMFISGYYPAHEGYSGWTDEILSFTLPEPATIPSPRIYM